MWNKLFTMYVEKTKEARNYLSKKLYFKVYMVAKQPGPRLAELLFLSVSANLSKVAFSTTIGE